MERRSSERILAAGLPGDLADLSVVHGAEDRGITHPLPDPQLDADAGVEEEHGGQGEQEKSHHDEGGVGLPVSQGGPSLLAANVITIVQEVVFDLGGGKENSHHRTCDEAKSLNNPNKDLDMIYSLLEVRVKYSPTDTCRQKPGLR